MQLRMLEDIEREFGELFSEAKEMVDCDSSYCERVVAALQLNQQRRSQAIEAIALLLARVRKHWPEGAPLREAIGLALGEGDFAAFRAFECATVALRSLQRPERSTATTSPTPRDPPPARGPRRVKRIP